MGRNNSITTIEECQTALAYLRKGFAKNELTLFANPARASNEMNHIEALLPTLREVDVPGVFRSWLAAELTQAGRVKMLNSLRRKRADVKPARLRRRVISVSPAVYSQLEGLSKATGGIPMPKLLESLAAIANVDKSLQKKLFNLALALSIK